MSRRTSRLPEVRLSPDELDLIRQAAAQAGTTLSEYIRRVLITGCGRPSHDRIIQSGPAKAAAREEPDDEPVSEDEAEMEADWGID